MDKTFSMGKARFAAQHVIVTADGTTLTRDGSVVIMGKVLAVLLPADEPAQDRTALVASVDDVEVTGRPWQSFGGAGDLRIGPTRWQLQPESVLQGSGLATPKKMRRARAAVDAFTAALAQTQTVAS
jgi:hypothetical protein